MHGPGRSWWIVAFPLVVGVAAFGATHVSRFLGPVVEAPQEIDLGPQPQNAVVRADVVIRNTGRRTLDMKEFASSCPLCIHMMRKTECGVELAQDLSLEPGQETTFTVQVGIHTPAGRPFEAWIYFKSNDAARPEVSIQLRAQVLGQILASPREIDLGRLSKNQRATTKVQICDTGRRTPCRIRAVEGTPPSLVQVRDLRVVPAATVAAESPLGTTLAEFEVLVETASEAGVFEGSVAVFEEGREEAVLSIPLRWQILPEFELIPSSVVLPRFEEGRPTYSCVCACRSFRDQPVELAVDNLPEGLRVVPILGPSDPPSLKRFSVEWLPTDREAARGVQRKNLRLRVKCGQVEESVDLSIQCWKP